MSSMQNRELSWLKFNERVLAEASNQNVPLLERLKFVSIFNSNLDEFFMIRVGTLFDLNEIESTAVDNKTGMTPREQIDKILQTVRPLYKKRDEIYSDIESQLRVHGIYDLEYEEMSAGEQKLVKQYFKNSILPILSPQIIDSHHPFPHLQNNLLHFVTILKTKGKDAVAVIPIPNSLPSAFFLPGNETRYIRIENIVLQFANQVFEEYALKEFAIIRTTRNEDINFDDKNIDTEAHSIGNFSSDNDFRMQMKKLLTKRKRLYSVRLEFSNTISVNLKDYLCKKLNLKNDQVFYSKSPMALGLAFSLQSKLPENKCKALTYKEFKPQPCGEINVNESIIKQIQKRDLLLSYPFESMRPFLRLIKESANDPNVISIKITIYRLAEKNKLVEYLCAAAENGKDVTVLIELRARFDEQNNISWSERLEEAGCNVIYGFENFKVHSKICLITRKEKNLVKYITQIGTGNYNEKTSELYTDVSLITYNQDIGKDATEFFKNMGIGNLYGTYDHILVAPVSLKSTLLKLIEEQIAQGNKGYIFIKINSLADDDIIEKLRQASCSGVTVKLIIRGICCLLPGIEGSTENIQITNIVGRFLEHSRIYCFGTGSNQKMFISSADFLKRNTEHRVEVACPIYDERVKEKLLNIMEACDYDNVKARVLLPNGEYVEKQIIGDLIDSQQYLMNQAEKNVVSYTAKKPSKIKELKQRFARAYDAFRA